MKLTDQYMLPVSRERAWEALNDTVVLRAIIPGCESVEADGEHAYAVSLGAAVGPVRAHFKGRISLTNIDAPNAYTVLFEGQGGAAGFAKGNADVRMEPHGESSTKLSYTAHAQVGGGLARIGSLLVDSAAQKIAGEFFKRFCSHMAREGVPPAARNAQADEQALTRSQFQSQFQSQSDGQSTQAAETAEHAAPGKGKKSWKAWISKF